MRIREEGFEGFDSKMLGIQIIEQTRFLEYTAHKPPTYFVSSSDTSFITRQCHTIRFPNLLISTAFHPSKNKNWILVNNEANIRSTKMRVAPINHHWWFDLPLSTYYPRLVGHTHIEKNQQSFTVKGVLITKGQLGGRRSSLPLFGNCKKVSQFLEKVP